MSTATTRLHNVLAQFEGSEDQQNGRKTPAVKLDDAWGAVQPSHAGKPQPRAVEHQVVAIVAGSMTLDIMACPDGQEHPQPGTTLPGKVLRRSLAFWWSVLAGGVN